MKKLWGVLCKKQRESKGEREEKETKRDSLSLSVCVCVYNILYFLKLDL